ncbi:hypothetical protein GCM10023093_21770 [Nemorincola caseinilytica]|uniref:Uncharacterized protein n=1 Tax=Nemorincola caseinilytica TaxID=2054315 RepID=A0ABP8NH16_9BACT
MQLRDICKCKWEFDFAAIHKPVEKVELPFAGIAADIIGEYLGIDFNPDITMLDDPHIITR